MHIKRLLAAASAGLLVAAAVPAVVYAATSTEVVMNSDVARQAENTPPTKNWVGYFRAAGDYSFRTGPATAPLGAGSLELSTPTGADKITVFNYDHVGTALSDVDAMSYSTYRTSGSAQQVAALNVQVDINGAAPGGFTTLVFEPVYNTDQGAVVGGQWQDWDAYNGGNAIWWSSNPIPGAPNRDTFVSWDTIVTANPDAVIVGGFGINQGSGNPALVTAVDALTLGYNGNTTVYDFEPTIRLANKDACKNDGWKTSNSPTYKNQGDCVSDFASNGKAKGNPSVVTSVTNALARFF